MAAVGAGVRVVAPKVDPPVIDGTDPLDEQAIGLAGVGDCYQLPRPDPEGRSDQQPVSRFEGGTHAGTGHDHAPERQRPELS
jgi:hypothetical protein